MTKPRWKRGIRGLPTRAKKRQARAKKRRWFNAESERDLIRKMLAEGGGSSWVRLARHTLPEYKAVQK